MSGAGVCSAPLSSGPDGAPRRVPGVAGVEKTAAETKKRRFLLFRTSSGRLCVGKMKQALVSAPDFSYLCKVVFTGKRKK